MLSMTSAKASARSPIDSALLFGLFEVGHSHA
jgi:hypothetical protein